MAKSRRSGLKKWFREEWVNIGAKKKDGSHPKCGRKKASTKRAGYPKCVPKATAKRMTAAEKKSAVARKRSKAQGVRGKPTNVKTFTRRKR